MESINLDSLLAKTVHTRTDTNFSPVFYRVSNNKEYDALLELLMRFPFISIHDEIIHQLKDLLKIRNPTKRYSEDQLLSEVDLFLKDKDKNLYGVWVYYPWSYRLVHILDEKEFIEVRTSRNKYKISPEEQAALGHKKVGVIGLSVGQSVVMSIIQERSAGEIRIADFDTLDLSNYNRLRTSLVNIGLNKAVSVAREISEIDPFIKVTCFMEGVTKDTIDIFLTEGGKLDALIDECDSIDIKVLCRLKAKSYGIPVLMEASDRGTIDVERFDIEYDRPIIHGFLEGLDVEKIFECKPEEKVPYILKMAGIDTLSNRMKASMIEIGSTITTWPQLASAVNYGGGITADTYRRMMLGEFTGSGRFFIDMEELIKDKDEKSNVAKKESKLGPLESMSLQEEEINRYCIGKCELLSESQILELLTVVSYSPSYYNAEPWRFLWYADRLVVCILKSEKNTLFNADNLLNICSCGMALQNLSLKAQAMGYSISSNFVKGIGNSNDALVLEFHKGIIQNNDSDWIGLIGKRKTGRGFGNSLSVPKNSFDLLSSSILDKNTFTLNWLEDKSRIADFAKLVSKVEQVLLYNKSYYEGYTNSLNWEHNTKQTTGINVYEMDINPIEYSRFQMVKNWKVLDYLKSWGVGQSLGSWNASVLQAAEVIGVLSSNGKSKQGYLQAGIEFERIWLEATRLDLSIELISPLNTILALINSKNETLLHDISKSLLIDVESSLDSFFTLPSGDEKILLFRLFKSDIIESGDRRISPRELFLSTHDRIIKHT